MGPPPPSVENLFWYLKISSQKPSCFRSHNKYIVDICHDLPWSNRDTILCVLSYTFSFISTLDHSDFFTSDAIIALDQIARCVRDGTESVKKEHQIDSKQREFSEKLVNSFFPQVVPRLIFTVPKLHQLPLSDQHLYPNEILAAFINFFLQVLFRESNISEDKEKRWALLRKELSFLLALLGDTPFQCIHHDLVGQVTNLLAEFEMLANEAGSLVYDGVFPIHQMEANTFHGRTIGWLEKVEHLNAKIKEHCFKFSELPMSAISRSNVVDSFFIVHSLIQDIENLNNHGLDFNHGDAVMAAQMKTLHGQLTQSQSFIRFMQDNEEKEGLIQIRDLTYEAEYLINSLVVGNIHVWYLNLRLPSIIHKIKLALIGLQQVSETKGINDCDVKVSCPTTGTMNIFEHSYMYLPRNLKPCFLYFAGFCEYYEISQEKLTRMWIAEGFIQRDENKSIEDTAYTYLSDLINRNLVLITEKGSDGRIKECKIQSDGLHEFCARKAKEENFMIEVNNSQFYMYERCQRLRVPSPNPYVCWRPFGLHCRSFRDEYFQRLQSSYCFQTMALLKVGDQAPNIYSNQQEAAAFAFPAQLRYLGVGSGDLLNKMVANLVNLEFIYVSGHENGRVYCVPPVVLRMVKLRRLVMEGRAAFEFEKDCSSNMKETTTNLRTLTGVGINDKKDSVDILRCFPHLHKLKCIIKTGTEFPDLSFMIALESLKLSFSRNGTQDAKILSSKIPLTIKKISLSESRLPWEMMSIIGRLPNLEVLKLKENAFEGPVWETRDGEFQKLKFLKIIRCGKLVLWMSCSEHFPVIECLLLRGCHSLVEIPSDFRNIPTLQRIELNDRTDEACFSAHPGFQLIRQLENRKLLALFH